ncbi:precorrin-3B synthase [Calothrix sp. 336/3]|uniref:precorrin-3B synthase n=1 Tax=Calothrix sp. 336/3 TaxID=1337936 RepID=UPI0004E431AF|nr:precorrin-3B synthase [Calothrix sp. 336/3]AKG24205.1 precorrin-3B synthase [Calothrix sp. 336/3]
MLLASDSVSCPGIFYGTSARDGKLLRIRIPGGILHSQQFVAIAELATSYGSTYINITNRGNIQIREIHQDISTDFLVKLQKLALAARIPEVDHLRNIMGSPTAGIDRDELIDTRPLVQELDSYISTHPEIAPLSPKFSIAVDGGGAVTISCQPNDIYLTAVRIDQQVYFSLRLHQENTASILLRPEECVMAIAAVIQVYLQNSPTTQIATPTRRKSSQPRLKEVVQAVGVEKFLLAIAQQLGKSLPRFHHPPTQYPSYLHIGIHPQRQSGYSYIGVPLPLGRIETQQINALADIATTYGNGTIRLTPWQNFILSDIKNEYLHVVEQKLKELQLPISTNNIFAALVACRGNQGCAAAAGDTQKHALELAEFLHQRVQLQHPVNIHFTGCDKSCAQQTPSDITCLGVSETSPAGTLEKYQVYLGDQQSRFGRLLSSPIGVTELFPILEKILQLYLSQGNRESFREFINRYSIADLQRILQ